MTRFLYQCRLVKRTLKNSKYWFFVALVVGAAACSTIKRIQFAKNKVIAHRGAWKTAQFPQNSIAALQQAVTLKCAGTEFDVRMTADNVLVINHDPTFFGDTIEQKTYRELSRHALKNGEKLPTLRKYIKEGKRNNEQTRLVLEVKPSIINKEQSIRAAEEAVEIVRKMKARHLVVYISFDFEILKRIHELDPLASTQYLTGDKTPAEIKEAGFSGIDYHFSVYRQHPEWLTEARQHGLVLNAWTVNDAETMDWLLAEDFDFITTDQPELLLERVRIHEKKLAKH